jgi:hypothetical protein
VSDRAKTLLQRCKQDDSRLALALTTLSLGRAVLYRTILQNSEAEDFESVIEQAVMGLRLAGHLNYLPLGLLTRALLRTRIGKFANARADLDEAWEIAERGPMRLHMADIRLSRARLFFHERTYPWTSAKADLAAAEKLINDCGYHRRDQELADAKMIILS